MELPPSPTALIRRLSRLSLFPGLLFAGGSALLLAAIAKVAVALVGGGNVPVAVLEFVFVGTPGIALAYTGIRLPESEIHREQYPRVIGWVLGGVLLMYGFILLRALHPAVAVQWSIGTQVIAVTVGSLGGLAVGIQETKANTRREQLRTRTEELTEREAELERKNEELERFASVLSHDFRNPLSVAQGNPELAREDADSERLKTVADAHERMATLIEDLLTLARQGDAIRDMESIELGALATACWENVTTADATLSVETADTIRADRDRLQQLLENLFRNAVEHGGEDVTITIGTVDGGFYVADDGPGIPPEDRDRVFENGYSTARQGTGLGLSIVRQVAAAHSWEIDVTESDSGGARFEFSGVEFA
ncbi:sensor histidine kinase [Halobellus marinus]|uniref:sensor histidine kinase n=1 Tax=Halobellus TaxID=1073986 RepID=UPI0028AA57D3|nr:HAMP domain-containing sensor histidine kinase [Halobellus sp. DFY28]